MPRRSFPPCTPSLAITIRSTTSCNDLGSCGGTWVRSTGKYSITLFIFFTESGPRSYHPDDIIFSSSSPTISALTLWEHDNSLTIALDVCNAFFEPIKYLINYFPGQGACHISHTTPFLLRNGQPSLSMNPSPGKAASRTSRTRSRRRGRE